MTTLQQHFDPQTDGAAVTTATSSASGNAFSSVTLNAVTLTYVSEQKMHGTRAMKVNGGTVTPSSGYASWAVTAVGTFSVRAYFRLTGLPSAPTSLIYAYNSVTTTDTESLLAINNTGTVGFLIGSVAYWTTGTLTLNTWYRMEATWRKGSAGSVLFNIYAGDSTTVLYTLNPTAIANGSVGPTSIQFGKNTSAPTMAAYYFDDLGFVDSATLLGPYVSAPPTVTAGANVDGSNNITLSASYTTYDSVAPTYVWSQTAGTALTLSSTTAASPTITAAPQGAYTFQVVITDDAGGTATDTVSVTIAGTTGSPTASVHMYHDVFVVDATASTAAAGGALTYAIAPSTGLTTLKPGLWVGLSPATATTYSITVTEAGNANVGTTSTVVPAATGSTTSGSAIRILMATADSTAGGTFA